jgi:hypothetical protein
MTARRKPLIVKASDGDSGVPGPNARDVDWDRKPVLYLPDGRVLVRVIGFGGA